MHTIGFKNFRRFEELSQKELAGITFFVGGNNAGKSTVVKAMMLLQDNITRSLGLIKGSPSIFVLGSESEKNTHVGTFGRALHKPYPSTQEIELECKIENITFKYVLGGDVESQRLSADIHTFDFRDEDKRWSITIDYLENKIYIVCPQRIVDGTSSRVLRVRRVFGDAKDTSDDELLAMKEHLDSELKKLRESLSSLDEIHQAIVNQEIKQKENQKKTLQAQWYVRHAELGKDELVTNTLDFSSEDLADEPRLFNLIDNLIERKQDEEQDSRSKTSSSDTRAKKEDSIKQYDNIKDWLIDVNREISLLSYKMDMVYIPSHSVAQRIFFSREDRNDYMSDVIGKYQSSNYADGGRQKLFVQKWMKDFGIGLDFKIDTIQGEAFTVTVTNMHGDEVPLADLGMGSIQIILLLLKLATLLDEHRRDSLLILVEEPEQNIHPKLQSVLAELFESVHRQYNVRFLIETHSEYMIRKTQAMIATGSVKFEENPFRVYYFPEEGEPYDMIYQESGMFENKFDEGFFDEASKQQFSVIKKAREIHNV